MCVFLGTLVPMSSLLSFLQRSKSFLISIDVNRESWLIGKPPKEMKQEAIITKITSLELYNTSQHNTPRIRTKPRRGVRRFDEKDGVESLKAGREAGRHKPFKTRAQQRSPLPTSVFTDRIQYSTQNR